jgi:hypothetical protein
MINGFTNIFNPASARIRNQRYLISPANRGKAIEILRKNGFESRNNMEFTRRNSLEIIFTEEQLEVNNSERGYHTKQNDLPSTLGDQQSRNEINRRDLELARRARQIRIQNQ